MKVNVIEIGQRPRLYTKGVAYAPEAAARWAFVLGELEFADLATVAIDWTGHTPYMDKDGNLPPNFELDKGIPVMYIQVIKHLPQFGPMVRLTVEQKVDIDDVFGADALTGALIIDLVEELRDTVRLQIEEREKQQNNG